VSEPFALSNACVNSWRNLLMARYRNRVAGLLATTLGLLAAAPAGAASLQQVSNWGVSGLPSDVSMYIYVPDKVATNPPILALVHYCGGTASAVFGQAQGGGIVSAADQYGFIMVVPSSGRCWDVMSNKTFTRDGGGDSHAISQMVRYAITKYSANADRVYSTGDSSGGMMTELLLHFKVIQDREEFYKKYEDRFRSIFYKQNGKVCVNDLLN